MEREDGRREKRPGDRQAPEDAVEEKDRREVEQDIGEMIPEHGIPPEAVLRPEGAVEGRIVLLGRPGLEPDPPEAVERAKVRARHVRVVVPDQAAPKGGPICREHRSGQRERDCAWESGSPHGELPSGLPFPSQ